MVKLGSIILHSSYGGSCRRVRRPRTDRRRNTSRRPPLTKCSRLNSQPYPRIVLLRPFWTKGHNKGLTPRGDYAPTCRALGKKTPEWTTSPDCIGPIHAVSAAQFRPRSWRARVVLRPTLAICGQLVSRCLPAPGGQRGFDLCSARVLAYGAAPGSLGLISAAQHCCAVIVSDAGLLVSTVEESTPAALATDGPADHFELLSKCRPIICQYMRGAHFTPAQL